jgi:RNA polymerase sigma-70 factor (ECF subfamily)
MATTRPKSAGGDLRALSVSLPVDYAGRTGHEILKLRERIAALFDELRYPLYRYLLCLGIRPEEAEETIQETFLRLCRHLHGGGRDENLRGWVFRVAHNVAINRIKNQQFALAVTEDEWKSLAETTIHPGLGPEELVLRKEKMMRLQASISALSPQQQQCVHLRAEGFRYREIAEILGVAVPTVGESLRRAMEKLTRDAHG